MTMKIALLAAGVLAVVLWLFARRGDVSSAEARRLVQGGAVLLDVRTPGEFTSRHIDGALNIPVQELDRRMGELGQKDRPVVVYCRSGSRSARAAQMLKRAGYSAVHDLGAMGSW
jgi:phage shock protein E